MPSNRPMKLAAWVAPSVSLLPRRLGGPRHPARAARGAGGRSSPRADAVGSGNPWQGGPRITILAGAPLPPHAWAG